MKALLICEQYNFNEIRFWEISKIKSAMGIERLSSNAYTFDLAVASKALAHIQAFLSETSHAYHVIYLTDNYVHFKDPVNINTSLTSSAPEA